MTLDLLWFAGCWSVGELCLCLRRLPEYRHQSRGDSDRVTGSVSSNLSAADPLTLFREREERLSLHWDGKWGKYDAWDIRKYVCTRMLCDTRLISVYYKYWPHTPCGSFGWALCRSTLIMDMVLLQGNRLRFQNRMHLTKMFCECLVSKYLRTWGL